MNEKTVSWKQIALVAIGVAALLVGTWEVMRWRQDQADRVLIQEMQENMRDQARINEKNLEALRIKQQQNEKAMATRLEKGQGQFHEDFNNAWNEAEQLMKNLDARYKK